MGALSGGVGHANPCGSHSRAPKSGPIVELMRASTFDQGCYVIDPLVSHRLIKRVSMCI